MRAAKLKIILTIIYAFVLLSGLAFAYIRSTIFLF